MNDASLIFDDIYRNNVWGNNESRSGHGSTLNSTRRVREFILHIVNKYNITSVVDLPCGDFNWMSSIVNNFDSYIGLDISETCISDNIKSYPDTNFKVFDVLVDEIPQSDLLIVRDMLSHFPLDYGKLAIGKIKKSKWKYLLSTHWQYFNADGSIDIDKQYAHRNINVGSFGDFFPINLTVEPFNMGEPIEYVYQDELGCVILGLWQRVPNKFI